MYIDAVDLTYVTFAKSLLNGIVITLEVHGCHDKRCSNVAGGGA